MRRAIQLAHESPNTHPNPRVGALVVDIAGTVLGEGCHDGPGLPHAEIVALEAAGDRARGATVYVTLEPCSHQGRTPPCSDALIAAGVSRVVVGAIDPDERVSGRGIELLQSAGIEVTTGLLEESSRAVDPGYFHHRETGMPLVTIKWAMTLDGSVAASDDTSQWITGEAARQEAHELRSRVDGVVVGSGTLRKDDPMLDVRLPVDAETQPRPVIVVGTGDLPSDARIWDRDPLVVSTRDLAIPSGDLIRVEGIEGIPDPADVCLKLADLGLLDLLLEGGPTLAGAWWRAGVITQGVVYVGAKVGGGTGRSPMSGIFSTIGDAEDVEFETVRGVSDDAVIVFKRKT